MTEPVQVLKYSSGKEKRELANRMMRQRVAHAPREPLFGSTAGEVVAIPESHYRLDLHPAYLNLLERMAELEPSAEPEFAAALGRLLEDDLDRAKERAL